MSSQLTPEELEILILIKTIEDFEEENPGNLPPGGIGEVIVSSDIKTPEEFDKITDVLYENGLTDEDNATTSKGKEYIEKLTKEMESGKVNLSTAILTTLKKFLEEDIEKYPVIKNAGTICTLLGGIASLLTVLGIR